MIKMAYFNYFAKYGKYISFLLCQQMGGGGVSNDILVYVILGMNFQSGGWKFNGIMPFIRINTVSIAMF